MDYPIKMNRSKEKKTSYAITLLSDYLSYYTTIIRTQMYHSCPKTAVWINQDTVPKMQDPISQKHLCNMVYPVVIRGEPKYVYELSDLYRWFLESGGTSPTTRNAFKLEELEPVRYPGFKRCESTQNALQNATKFRWRAIEDPSGTPSVFTGANMPSIDHARPDVYDAHTERMMQERLMRDLDKRHHPHQALVSTQSQEVLAQDLDSLHKTYVSHAKWLSDDANYGYYSPILSTVRMNIDNERRRLALNHGEDSLREFKTAHALLDIPPSQPPPVIFPRINILSNDPVEILENLDALLRMPTLFYDEDKYQREQNILFLWRRLRGMGSGAVDHLAEFDRRVAESTATVTIMSPRLGLGPPIMSPVLGLGPPIMSPGLGLGPPTGIGLGPPTSLGLGPPTSRGLGPPTGIGLGPPSSRGLGHPS